MSPLAERERVRPRLAVLVSGNGSNLQAVLDARVDGRLDVDVVVVVSNNPEAFALTRADRAGVETVVSVQGRRSRADYDAELAELLIDRQIDLVVLAGWDRLLGRQFVGRLPVINLHPAKPGVFPGLGAIERAYDGWRNGTVTSGGVMVHVVPDEGVDDGPIIVTEDVPFEPGDTLESFAGRVHEVERRLLVQAISTVVGDAVGEAAGHPIINLSGI